jgi:hypothetical protein
MQGPDKSHSSRKRPPSIAAIRDAAKEVYGSGAEATRSSWAAIRFFSVFPTNSSRWRRVTEYPQSISRVNFQKPVV